MKKIEERNTVERRVEEEYIYSTPLGRLPRPDPRRSPPVVVALSFLLPSPHRLQSSVAAKKKRTRAADENESATTTSQSQSRLQPKKRANSCVLSPEFAKHGL